MAVVCSAALLLAVTAAQHLMICLCPHDDIAGECHRPAHRQPAPETGETASAAHRHHCADLQFATADLIAPAGILAIATPATSGRPPAAVAADEFQHLLRVQMLPATTAPPPLPFLHDYTRRLPRS